MSIKSQGHSLILVKGHSDFKVKCLTFGLYTQVSDSGPQGPLVPCCFPDFDTVSYGVNLAQSPECRFKIDVKCFISFPLSVSHFVLAD